MDPLTDLNNLYLFAKVVDHGGYTAAAKALGLQTSMLSRRIAALETHLGVRLLNRNSRRISLTDAGRVFHQHCAALVEEARAARTAIEQTRASPQGLVRISCPLGVLHLGARAILTQYLVDNPQVRIMLDATNRRVDVVEEGLDIALRVRLLPLEDSDLTLMPLLTSRRIFVASPDFLARHPPITHPSDLTNLPTLTMAHANNKHQWHFQSLTVTHQPRLATDDLETLRDAALLGTGVAYLPQSLVQEHLDQGQLVQVLADWPSPEGSLHAVFASRRGMVPAVRGLLDALLAGLNP
ncbi:MAG: HTH-type transcriptional regulator DmlR [Pseudomonas sp.]|nr:MAG: HTH-type transcriptional regulator DmlR [Pseudomonas sp.]